MIEHLSQDGPSEIVYLGQSSGHIAAWVNTLPIIGPCVKRFLVRKADRSHDKKVKTHDRLTTIGIFALSLWRAYKFRRMLALCRQGVFVITDRYPQAEVPGFFYDGPGLKRINKESWMARKLAAREQQMYKWMANHLPAVVIRLKVDADTAFTRKPDHNYATLCDKIKVMQDLHFNGAQILELDSCDPSEEVLKEAMEAVHLLKADSKEVVVKTKLEEPSSGSSSSLSRLVD
ncbi:MAG: hypothetical protein ACI97A_004372 [Planctomycetota bacterium]|jgi:hypothetical protein